MERIAGPLMDRPTSRLTQAGVVDVIRPVWETINETARRLLGRIEQIIDHTMAVVPGRLSATRPCGNVLRVLPRVPTVVRPRPAMPWRDLPSLLRQLAAAAGHRGAGTGTTAAHVLSSNQ